MAAAADLARPTTRTSSRCTPQMARGTHAFEIAGYSLHRGLGAGTFIRSAPFDVGGYTWCIRFYPDGYAEHDHDDVGGGGGEADDDNVMVAAFLELLSANSVARAHYDFRLVDASTGQSISVFSSASAGTPPPVFDSRDAAATSEEEGRCVAFAWGTDELMARSELEESGYVRDDRVVLECDVTVVKAPRVEETTFEGLVDQAPPSPSDISGHFGRLLMSLSIYARKLAMYRFTSKYCT